MIKVERSYPAPASLEIESKKENGKYNSADVVGQLVHDFNGKCYICGRGKLQDPQVEHLLPHKGGKYPERKYDWDNLFLSCGHCNRVKEQARYDENIMDCCKDDPEEYIDFCYTPEKVNVTAKNPDNYVVVNTAQLVSDVFTLKNTGMRVYASQMRLDQLTEEMNVLYSCLDKYKKRNSIIVKRTIIALLKRESRFSEYKRNFIRMHIDEYSEFEQYLK